MLSLGIPILVLLLGLLASWRSYWKNVRKLCVMELLSASKIRSFAWLREEELSKLTSSLKDASAANQAVDIGASVGGVLEELIYRMLYGAPKNDDLALRAVVLEALRLSGTLNIADYLPFLAPFDPQGLKRRIKKLMKTVDDVLEKIINNHEDETRKEHRTHRDLVDNSVGDAPRIVNDAPPVDLRSSTNLLL
ncbi:hypothetical protein BVRB_9g208160 [Beta vulgaris subsp. vulgaris]|nr:hypothetical protein BVRB_9g208160 [Beta vulgaris subsp. vulgaris]